MPPLEPYPVHLGRLRFPALVNASDTLGESLEAVGAALVAGERRPRPLELSVHLYGDKSEADPKAVGDRLRRQITGLLENPRALLEGLWLSFSPDPMLAAYVLIGGGKVKIEDPSLTLGDFELELDGIYRVGTKRLHRPGRRVDLRDLRNPIAWVDIRRERYSGDFVGYADTFAHYAGVWLPKGAQGILLEGRWTGSQDGRRELLGGEEIYLWSARIGPAGHPEGLTNGTVVGFEADPAPLDPSDVVLYDMRTGATPVVTHAGDVDPSLYGWEEAYGPAHPLANPPTMANGYVRIRPDLSSADSVWIVESVDPDADPATRTYVERGRIVFGRRWDTSGGTQIISVTRIVANGIVDWTPERATIRMTVEGGLASTSGYFLMDLYLTLQRGWTGPLVEAYVQTQDDGASSPAGVSNPVLFFVPADAGERVLVHDGIGTPAGRPVRISGEAGFTWAGFGAYTFGTLPYAWLERNDAAGTGVGMAIATAIADTKIDTADDLGIYGTLRRAVQIEGADSYLGVALGFGKPGAGFEAEALRNASGTTSQVADANASGGQAVQDTQAASTADTLRLTAALQTPLDIGSYDVWVRARVSAAAVTGKITVTAGILAATTADVTSQTYVWVKASSPVDLSAQGSRATIAVRAWRSAGAAGTGPIIDRIRFIPRTRRSTPVTLADGPADRAAEHLFDVRPVATLLPR